MISDNLDRMWWKERRLRSGMRRHGADPQPLRTLRFRVHSGQSASHQLRLVRYIIYFFLAKSNVVVVTVGGFCRSKNCTCVASLHILAALGKILANVQSKSMTLPFWYTVASVAIRTYGYRPIFFVFLHSVLCFSRESRSRTSSDIFCMTGTMDEMQSVQPQHVLTIPGKVTNFEVSRPW